MAIGLGKKNSNADPADLTAASKTPGTSTSTGGTQAQRQVEQLPLRCQVQAAQTQQLPQGLAQEKALTKKARAEKAPVKISQTSTTLP